mmetsp:Transcript_7397/g.27860  ORF Transcript_7397/g.27860 Transcript_7397/m.27860 type:complete len:502 (-) Transcript_7397:1697-3202(-)
MASDSRNSTGPTSSDSTALSLPCQPCGVVKVLVGDEAGRGTCHKCGGKLSRGNLALAMQCGGCKTRFHGSDCGGKLADAGYTDMHDKCPKCNGICLCVGGACACHASNARRKRQVNASLKEVVDRRSLEIRNAAYLGEEPPPVSASTLAAVELIKSARLTGARDAVVESETGGAATKPYPKVFESAVYAWQAKQTLAVDDDAYLMNVLVDYDALRDENEKLKSQNQGLQLQNETLQLEVTALRAAVGSNSENEPVVNMSEFAEQFVRDPEMRRGGLMALYEKHINRGGTRAPAASARGTPVAKSKRKMHLSEFGADPEPPRPGPACETTDFRQRVVRNARYLGRFLALLAVIALFALSMYNQKVYSTRVYCENDEVILNAALRQGLQVADLFHFKAGMDCHEKVQATMAVYAVILIAWHVLCIEAWMGFRFVRAMMLMWRWDVKSRAAAKRNAALARKDALRSDASWEKKTLEIVIDDETGSNCETSSISSSFNDSAQGDD